MACTRHDCSGCLRFLDFLAVFSWGCGDKSCLFAKSVNVSQSMNKLKAYLVDGIVVQIEGCVPCLGVTKGLLTVDVISGE